MTLFPEIFRTVNGIVHEWRNPIEKLADRLKYWTGYCSANGIQRVSGENWDENNTWKKKKKKVPISNPGELFLIQRGNIPSIGRRETDLSSGKKEKRERNWRGKD